MATVATAPERATAQRARRSPRPRRGGPRGREGLHGWLFVSPALLVLVLFLLLPIVLALLVSFTSWNGQSQFLGASTRWVGLHNYDTLLTTDSLTRKDFATSLRNNFYFVLGVVPLQTALALFLAMVVNQRFLKGRGFFRTAFYFPSITSSVAIALVFIFLFQGEGAINRVLAALGIHGPQWFADPRGLIHLLLGAFGVDSPPAWAQHEVFSLSVWDWIAGPSVAMSAIMLLVIWTTAGTFMLMFLGGLQNISGEVEEAALIDGASTWERFRFVTLPMLKPTLFLVLTLGLIGTWQVFDQIYVMSGGNPSKTTLTPAYLSYTTAFNNSRFGVGAAMAFLLFALIVVLTTLQRLALRDRED
jgi:multiple sugar transport system permease protein